MLTDLQRDILIKSAEGIQEGMWCRGQWFAREITPSGLAVDNLDSHAPNEIMFDVESGKLIMDAEALMGIASKHRCVEGEVAYRTALLGGSYQDYLEVLAVASVAVLESCSRCRDALEDGDNAPLFQHNDECMKKLDVFTAGQQWADIFRSLL